jgi:hypothetical protein
MTSTKRRSRRDLTQIAKSAFVRHCSDPVIQALPPWPLSDGEINFLHWFIQGSIMIPETRRALRRAWGFCERHAWAALAIEMCFRPTFLPVSALLYEDLLERCLVNFRGQAPFRARRVARRLTPQGPCLMCELNTYRAGRGGASQSTIERGRQTAPLWRFAIDNKEYWDAAVCGACRGRDSKIRCRRHLIEQAGFTEYSVKLHVDLIAGLLDCVRRLARSYVWENRGTHRPRDRAALISAVGFMSGWRPLLLLLEAPRSHTAAADDCV